MLGAQRNPESLFILQKKLVVVEYFLNSCSLLACRIKKHVLDVSPSAGEHVRLWTRSLLPSVPLHLTAHSAASALSSRQPPHSLSAALNTFSSIYPSLNPPKLISLP